MIIKKTKGELFMTKKKSRLMIFFGLALTVGLIGFVFGSFNDVKAQSLSVFDGGNLTESVEKITDDMYSKCLVVSGITEGASSRLKGDYCGDFSLTFNIPNGNLNVLKTVFTSNNNESFSVAYYKSASDNGVYVEYGGEKAGINYEKKNMEYTSERNAEGKYTSVKGDYITLKFDCEKMCVYVSSDTQAETLVWNFKQRFNDGRDIKALLDSFKSYKVDFVFEKVEYNTLPILHVYSLNGVDFTATLTQDKIAPNVFAFCDTEPIVGEDFILPKPYAFDVADGNINCNEVNVVIYDDNKQIVFNKAYSDGVKYEFTKDGSYQIQYSVSDSSGNIGQYLVYCNCVKEKGNAEFKYSFPLDGKDYGLGETIVLPSAEVDYANSKKIKKTYANISVYKDEEIINGYSDLCSETENELLLSESGVYTVIYTADFDTAIVKEVFEINVVEGIAYLSNVNLEKNYGKGVEFVVPSASITIDGETVNASSRIKFPSGVSYSNLTVSLTEIGEYTISYFAVTKKGNYQFDKKFNVVESKSELFVDANNKTDVYESNVWFNQKETGVMLSMKAGARVTYKNPIDLSISGRSDFFITYYVVPNTIGNADFGALRFILTDIYDESNYIEILCKDSGAVNTGGIGAYVQASPLGQKLAMGNERSGFDNGQTNASGYITLAGFRGNVFPTHKKSMLQGGFALEYDSKKIYPNNAYGFAISGEYSTLYEITDLDNPDYYETPWKGFTDGKCYLTIVPEQVGSRANLLITSVGGVDLSDGNSIEDDELVMKSTEYSESFPIGIKNVDYKIPSMEALSKYYGKLEVQERVYYVVNNLPCEISVKDGKFTPTETGRYTIEYYAVTPNGVSKTKTVSINVMDEYKNVSIVIKDEKQVSCKVGDQINIAEISVNDPIGNYSVSVIAKSPSDKELSVTDNVFTPNESGKWSIIYKVTDYLGREAESSYDIDVSIYQMPVIQSNVSLPEGFINGFTYQLPIGEALDYTQDESNPTTVYSEIYVTDANGRNKIDGSTQYVASVANHGDNVLVEYVYKGLSGQDSVQTYNLKGLIVKDGKNIDSSKYFVLSEGIEINRSIEYTSFTFDSEGASIGFANAIISSGAKIVFDINPLKNNFNSVKIILTDSVNANERIELNVYKNNPSSNKSIFRLNDGWEKSTVGSFFGNSPDKFTFSYNNTSTSISDGSGDRIVSVNKTVFGEDFNGFTSGKVYLKIEFYGVEGESEFVLYSISGQTIGSSNKDKIAPLCEILNSVSGTYNINSVVSISPIYTSDVLGQISSAVVEVKRDGQTVLSSTSAYTEYELVLSQYGKYTVTYTVTDTNGNTKYEEEMIYVRGTEEPVIHVSGIIQKTCKLGKKIQVLGAVVEGGSGNSQYKVLAINPNGQMTLVTGSSVVANVAGKWTIRYVAYDQYYNIVIVDYTCVVS